MWRRLISRVLVLPVVLALSSAAEAQAAPATLVPIQAAPVAVTPAAVPEAAGSWSLAGSMGAARAHHTATLLPSGTVLVAGGSGDAGAELYDPASNSWSPAAGMSTARSDHTATLLPSGKVLVAGGSNPSTGTMASAELYDPAGNTWAPARSMSAARDDFTATLLPSGKVLVAGGCADSSCATNFLASAELYDPASDTWSPAGSMGAARSDFTATLLPSGKVLVAGGYNDGGDAMAGAELYDPASNTWAPAASMSAARDDFTATLLPSGEVLVAGGYSYSTRTTASAELYDPASNTWAPAASMSAARDDFTATLLPAGKVLVAGGHDYSSNTLAGAELYDPASNTWAPAASMSAARFMQAATLLPSGQVLVAGGVGLTPGSPTASAELYSPGISPNAPTVSGRAAATGLPTPGLASTPTLSVTAGAPLTSATPLTPTASGIWSPAGNMSAARALHTATLLPSGKVLVAGGCPDVSCGTYLGSAELFDPAGNTWSPAASLGAARGADTATLLPSGKVLVAGGCNGNDCDSAAGAAELYDPAVDAWSPAGSLGTARGLHTATLLPSGKVLVAGGVDTSRNALAGAELYDPATNSWSPAGSMSTARALHTATRLPSGKVLVAGGCSSEDCASPLASAEVYDPASDTWSPAGGLATARAWHTATLLLSGKVLVAGGCSGQGCNLAVASAELYDPASNTWAPAGSMAEARGLHTATLLASGQVLVAGGVTGSGNSVLASAELYDPASNTWAPTGSMAEARGVHTATLLRSGQVLVTGGSSGQGPLAGAELYTPGARPAGPVGGASGRPATPGVPPTTTLPSTPGVAMTPTLETTPGPTMTPTLGTTPGPTMTPTLGATPGPAMTPTLGTTPGPAMMPTVAATTSLAITPTVVVSASEAPGGRDTSPQSSLADQAALVSGNNAFAFALYDALRGEPGNLVFSPYGISSALAMAYAGAGGQTETQMSSTLHFALPRARLYPAFDALDLALAGRTQISSSFQLTVTNSLWGQTGYPFLESFLDVLKQDFGAGLQLVDFQAAPEPAREAINAWVADKTQGKIADLLPSGTVDSGTRLVLADALYFKGAWADPFEPGETTNGPFHLVDGSQVSVPMMEQKAFLDYAEGPDYQAVELPYSGSDILMVILLPPAGQWDAFEKSLSADRLANILQGLALTQVNLTLPKFKYGSAFALGKTLAALGMPDAFDPSAADFSGMDGQPHDFSIGEVVHQALVAVDESGTEAAAATGVNMPGAAVPAPDTKTFKADHPFVYLIRDAKTGTILFLGRVEDPSQG